MEYVKSYKDLEVYKLSNQLTIEFFELTKTFPKEETYSLTDQIRRSFRSVGAQIAEAWAKRKYEKHFISKLTDADGEQLETQHWLDIAYNCKYISEVKANELINRYLALGKMVYSMILKAEKFCSKPKIIEEIN